MFPCFCRVRKRKEIVIGYSLFNIVKFVRKIRNLTIAAWSNVF